MKQSVLIDLLTSGKLYDIVSSFKFVSLFQICPLLHLGPSVDNLGPLLHLVATFVSSTRCHFGNMYFIPCLHKNYYFGLINASTLHG